MRQCSPLSSHLSVLLQLAVQLHIAVVEKEIGQVLLLDLVNDLLLVIT